MKRLLLVLALVVGSTALFAQEICNNGIDDDGDGFIDCYDADCSANQACEDLFLGNDAACQATPPQFPQFTMSLDFASPDETTNHLARMAIGDLDRDGIAEFVTMNRYTNKLFILSGADGSILEEETVNFTPYWEVAIANINDDNCGEIFFMGYQDPPGNNNAGVYLFAYDCNLNFIWRSSHRLPDDPINFGLADFDGDGLVEIYAKDEIYDAHTGNRIIQSTASNYNRINGGPVAVDIVGDGRLELVIGLAIYEVNLGTRAVNSGSLTLLQSRSEYFIRGPYNATSVADFNQDGFLDVVASGSTNGYNQNTTVFFWDVQNNTLDTYRDNTGDYAPNGWGQGTGRINIADLDGDGQLNMSYVSGKYLYALDENLDLLWRVVINEETSGHTGCTLFDFNGDGKSEIVYRDERFLYIIDGTNGSIFNQQACISRTNREYPIVADVDSDGSTELCVTCGFDDDEAWDNFNTLSYSRYSHIRVFKSAGEPWVPARRVWNQHGYFVVNVNDDLTIPRVMQKHHLVFSSGSCTQGPNRPLNKFLNQAPFLDSQGCPTYAAFNLDFANTPTVDPPQCPDLDFQVSFDITNLGDVALSGEVPVSFYTSNPLLPGATKLNTVTIPISNLGLNQIYSVTNLTVSGNGSDSVYIVLNDAGTTLPSPISLPNTAFLECDYDNIIGLRVRPLPVAITAELIGPQEECTVPANGAVRAFVPDGGGENTTDYDFYWSIGNTAKPIANIDFIGPIYTGLAAGTYTVYAIHKTANCSSDTTQIDVPLQANAIPPITITATDQTTCSPPNGSLSALVDGGNAGFTFEWFELGNSLGITTPTISGLPAGNYTVVVSRGACNNNVSQAIANLTVIPEVSAAPTSIVDCSDPNTGSVTASVSVNGTPQPEGDYTFNWYLYDNATNTRGSLLPGTGATRTGLAAGFYEVVAVTNASNCASSITEIVQIETQTEVPEVSIVQVAPQTSCDPNNPNGVLQANVTLNGNPVDPATVTIRWFEGLNTLPANEHTVTSANGTIASEIRGGGQAYTVQVTTAFNCVATDDFVITEDINVPIVSLSKTDNSICDPGVTALTGSVTANITFDGNPVTDFTNYTITWHEGTSTADPVIAGETGAQITGRADGYYTIAVTRNDLFCEATPQTIEVENTTVLPAITTQVIPSQNCDPALANGELHVTDVDGAAPNTTLYSFQWHTGIGTTTPIAGATTPDLLNRQGGVGENYTILVRNLASGCENTETVLLSDDSELPVVTLQSTDNTICVGTPDGSTAIQSLTYRGNAVTTPFTGFTFAWSNGVTTPANNAVAAGNYSVTVTNTTDGCTSDPVDIDVNDDLFIPPLDVTIINNQTSCDPVNPNGSLAVTVDETSIGGNAAENSTTLYSFEWVNHGDPFASPGTPAGNTAAINNLAGNLNYAVTVTRLATGCSNSEAVYLQETITFPVVTAAVTNDVTRCDTPNGSIEANVGGAEVGYTFFWLDETGSNQTADPLDVVNNASNTTIDNGDYLNLIPGYYTVVARDNNTSCLSQPLTREVILNVAPINITINVTALPSDCATANGAMLATPAGGTGPYTFEWYRGGPVNADIDFFTNPPVFNPNTTIGAAAAITGLTSDLYAVVVTDTDNGCKNYRTHFLPFADRHDIARTIAPSTICEPGGNGQLDIAVVLAPSPPSPATDGSDYIIRVYQGENPIVANQLGGDIIPAPANTPTSYTNLESGKYLIEIQETFSLSDCKVYEVIEIEQHALPALITVDAITANTACTPANSDGEAAISITSDANDLTTGFTYAIDVTPAPVGWGGTINTGPYPPTGLPETINLTGLSGQHVVPQYTVTVTTSNNCISERIISVPHQPLVPVITAADIDNALLCSVPSGSVEVTAVDVTGGNGTNPDFTNLNNYQYTWFDNAALAPAGGIFSAQGGAATPGQLLNGTSFPTVGPGSYWVVVQKNNGTDGLGCVSAPFKADILDDSVDPVFTLDAFDNTACDTNSEGALRITVTNPGSVAAIDYTYTQLAGPSTLVIPGTSDGDGVLADDNYADLDDGTYTIRVRNNTTSCFSEQTRTIIRRPVPVTITATPVNQLTCNPDGSITVATFLNGNPDPVANFDFTWIDADPNAPPVINQINGANTRTSLLAGTYYVQASRVAGLNVGSGCSSPLLRVDLTDESVDPTVAIVVTPNTSCNTANPNGTLVATAGERDGTTDNYTFAWTLNGGALHAATQQNDASPTSNLTQATQGIYRITVNNTVTGCSFDQLAAVQLNQSLSQPNIVTVIPTDPFDCNPSGSAQVTEINIANITTYTNPPDDIDTGFDYEWYDTNNNLIAGETNSSLLNLAPGNYYVIVEDLSTNCRSSQPVQTTINPFVNPEQVIIDQTQEQYGCTSPGTAILVATVNGQDDTNPNYQFTWYPTLDLTGASFASTSTISNLFDGNFSVDVLNVASNCRTSAFYIVENESQQFLPILSLSANPVTLCNANDAFITATAIVAPFIADYPFALNYTAEILQPAPEVMNANSATNFSSTNVQMNTDYEVRLTDNNTGCTTTGTVRVEDGRVFPTPVIEPLAPVTNCDPARPNGVARVTNNGVVVNFQFDWYEGATVTGTPVFTGVQYGLLKPDPTQYTVEATNLISGCTGTAQIQIPTNFAPIPSPNIDVLSHVTSCIADNGALFAYVGAEKNTWDYIFDWYDGTQEKVTPDFIGEIYSDLSTGLYSVTATSRITGCKSPLTTEEILNQQLFPEFDFFVQSSTCDINNGYASLIMQTNVPIASIIWESLTTGAIVTGSNLTDAFSGEYRVTVVSELGCSTTKDVVINADIRPFNGISRNNDTSNDIFQIDCIQNYPNNIVKIFNRAGTLVYEAASYDNTNVVFDGKSNKGINLMGNNLPAGTYFYIIDRGDGSKPLAGYLEIVN